MHGVGSIDLEGSTTYEAVLNRNIRTIPFTSIEIEELRKERILITGAGGSIGSRISMALSKIGGVNFLATDRDESALHSLSLRLTSTALFEGNNFQLLDIRDRVGAQIIADEFKPTVLIHAAALKHLSVLEKQPREALLSNVYGTLNMLEVAQSVGAKRFINISTDKAATPVSVLGRSKYLAELMTAQFKRSTVCDFKSVRFGNVYGSRGSVIETFINQISRKLPITLTDPNVTRFFMHPDEAAFLTLKSLLLGEGDLYLFDMGEPVLIIDLINSLQRLLGGQSNILFTGLREGEKLTEDLFDGVENRSIVIPKLIERGDHVESIRKNMHLIQSALQREDAALMQFLQSKTYPKV
jgi:FlaA1/EpsC-like NDP-sugar epimerase